MFRISSTIRFSASSLPFGAFQRHKLVHRQVVPSVWLGGMLRPVACAVTSAAAIAACLTFGLEGLHRHLSDRPSRSDQSGVAQKSARAHPPAQDESRPASAPIVVASAVAPESV